MLRHYHAYASAFSACIAGDDSSEERLPAGLDVVDEFAISSASLLLHAEYIVSVETVTVAAESCLDCVGAGANPNIPAALMLELAG